MFKSAFTLKMPFRPMGLTRASVPMVCGALSAMGLYQPIARLNGPPKAIPESKSDAIVPNVEPVITVPEYLQRLQEAQNRRIQHNKEEMCKELRRWKPFQTFSNPMICMEMSTSLLNDLDYMRVMNETPPKCSSRKENVYRQWERCQRQATTDDEMAFMIHLSHYYRLHEL